MPVRGSYAGSSHVTESVVSQIPDRARRARGASRTWSCSPRPTGRTCSTRPSCAQDGLDRHVYVPPPDEDGRRKILRRLPRAGRRPPRRRHQRRRPGRADRGVRRRGHRGPRPRGETRRNARVYHRHGRKDEIRSGPTRPANIRLTKAHFEAALEKVRGSLDRDALEAAERQAWEMMYRPGAAVRPRGGGGRGPPGRGLATMGLAPENELRQQADALRRAVFARKKDFESLASRPRP